ncbi:MAG TPA: RNA-binding domain-containing protein [Blastocatellia bacterium]|nr:RNA-binding domain-containing protein [Blastocatellia bacterium]
MARKRTHSSRRQRQSPGSERSYQEYLLSAPAPVTTRTELVRMLRGGEDTYLELKVRFSNVEKITAEIIALANTDGGSMIFGVNDQLRIEGVEDPESVEENLRDICAHQIQPPVFPYINKVAFDNGRRIVVLEVDSHNRPHRTLDDRFYLREGSSKREASREELSGLYDEAQVTHFEQVPVFRAQIEDIDESLFWSYVRGVNPGYWGETARGFPTDYVMRDMGMAVNFGEEVIPTLGGMLLFGLGDRVAEMLPRAEVVLTRFSGPASSHTQPTSHAVIERLHCQGNLFRLFEGALNFIRRYADLWDERPTRRALQQQGAETDPQFSVARANYLRGVIIEALTNSLVHRDWSRHASHARINIYDDSIEFINPARMLELPIISLRYGVSGAPNPRLKAVFTNRHYGLPTTRGGIPMIFDEAMNFARRAPEGPVIANHEFRLKIYGLR